MKSVREEIMKGCVKWWNSPVYTGFGSFFPGHPDCVHLMAQQDVIHGTHTEVEITFRFVGRNTLNDLITAVEQDLAEIAREMRPSIKPRSRWKRFLDWCYYDAISI